MRMQTYFIDNELILTESLYCTIKRKILFDNDERAILCKSVIETVKNLGSTDIIHCNGWISCLVPLYIKTAYKIILCLPTLKSYIPYTMINLIKTQSFFYCEAEINDDT